MIRTMFQILIFLTAAASAHLLDTRALIEQALDEPAKITLEKITLADAVARLTEQTGVRIVLPKDIVALAPYGGDTLIEKVDIANVPLREGLARVFEPLGMVVVVEEDHVRVAAREGLLCLGRAPTWAELDTLTWLAGLQPGTIDSDREELLTRVQCQAGSIGNLRAALSSVGSGPGDSVLTVATAQFGCGWCVSDRMVVIATLESRVRQRLQKPITVRVANKPLFDVLSAINDAVGLPARVEPGAIASLPPPMQRNYSLTVLDQPAERALEKIAADTGLGYLINPDGVVFYRPTSQQGDPSEAPRGPSTSGATGDPYVAKVVRMIGEGQSVEWLIRASELPPDLRELRQRDLDEAFASLRRAATGVGN